MSSQTAVQDEIYSTLPAVLRNMSNRNARLVGIISLKQASVGEHYTESFEKCSAKKHADEMKFIDVVLEPHFTDIRLLRTVMFVPRKSIFSYISPC